MLWQQHAPDFLMIDDVDRDLPRIRDTFLAWLQYKGVDLGQDSPARLGRRARIERVAFTRKGDTAETRVALSLGSRSTEASRVGNGTTDEIIRLTAEATLEAINGLLPVVAFGVEHVYNINHNPIHQIAMVVVKDPESSGHDRFVGAAQIQASVPDAAAKATMAAINRRAEIAAAMLGI